MDAREGATNPEAAAAELAASEEQGGAVAVDQQPL